MRYHLKNLCIGTAVIAGLTLAGCAHDKFTDKLDKDKLARLCKTYCDANTAPPKPGFALMMKKAWVNGKRTDVPMRDILIKSVDDVTGRPNLVTPYNASYGLNPSGDGLPTVNKSAGLDPACFAKEAYEPIDLSTVDLTTENTTITFVNFDSNGRLESRDIAFGNPLFADIESIITGSPAGDYVQVQNALSNISRPAESDLTGNLSEFSIRNLFVNGTPSKKTPFYSNLQTPSFSDEVGHVYFYVLLDEHLYFSRDTTALIVHAPEVESAMEKFYTPFVQYPITPIVTNASGEPDGTQLDVLTFHFIRDESMGGEEIAECRYVFDKYVISRGQDGYSQSTPLFIDPEVKTRGVVVE